MRHDEGINIEVCFFEEIRKGWMKSVAMLAQTSRERPKSAPYLKLNKFRKPLFLQLETTTALKTLKIDEKNFPDSFRNFFEVSSKSHSVEKCKRGDPLGFFEHPFCCKTSKN